MLRVRELRFERKRGERGRQNCSMREVERVKERTKERGERV